MSRAYHCTGNEQVKENEVVEHQKALKDAADEAKRANKLVVNLIEKNHFHLFLFRAAGGKLKERKT